MMKCSRKLTLQEYELFNFEDGNKSCSKWCRVLSEWLLFNANGAIFQLYHGENKLHFDEMMMMFDLH